MVVLQGDSPRAKEIAALLGQKMDSLEVAIRKAIARKVVEDFKDPLGPLKAMTEAAYAPPGQFHHFPPSLSVSCLVSMFTHK